jgi:hypothetical protein
LPVPGTKSSTYDAGAMADAYAAIINDARAAIADGQEPDGKALEERIRKVDGNKVAEKRALQQLERVLSIHRARGALARKTAQPAVAPVRRLRAQPTITGNMEVRRDKRDESFVLSWDTAAGIAQWEVRISERPDARGDYAVLETSTRAAAETSVELPLRDLPMRVHLLGRSRDGRLIRRAVISGLTRESWSERWQRRASAS